MLIPGNVIRTLCFVPGKELILLMDTTAISDLLATSLGTMTLEKLLTTVLTLLVCLVGIRIVGKLMARIMDKLTWDAICLPFRIAATFKRSAKDEFVHDPMHTWSTLIFCSSATDFT